MNKKYTLLHFGLLSLALMYNFVFYKSISWELAILAIIFILVEPSIFIVAKKSKGIERVGFGVLLLILVSFNLLAISSSFINKYNKESSIKTLNTEYTKQQEKLKQLKSSVINIETELNNYPTLEAFTAKSPKWEDKTQLNQTWQDGKKDINSRLTTVQQEYNKELSTNIDKYKIASKDNGYNAMFTAISSKINVKTNNLVLIIYMLFAVILEILVFYTKTLSVKESRNYVKSAKEMTIDLVEEMSYEWHKNYLQMIKNNFDKNLNSGPEEKVIVKVIEKDVGQSEETKIQEPEQKLLEESKEDPQENLFEKKVLNLDNLETVFNYIIENKNENIAPGMKRTSDNTEVKYCEVVRIWDELKKYGYLEPDKVNKQTIVVKENLDINDFSEE